MKTSELTGAALDWAVAKCEHTGAADAWLAMWLQGGAKRNILEITNSPSTNWAQGGPIVEREIDNYERHTDYFHCNRFVRPITPEHNHVIWATGPTLLIAAMRCYVASRLGEEVDVPDELKLKG